MLKFISLKAFSRASEEVELINEKLVVANSRKAVIELNANSGYLTDVLRCIINF